MAKTQERALIIDGNNYLWRAFYACPPMSTRGGFPTNAVRGFFTILTTDIKILKPEYLVVVFDAAGGTDDRIKLLPGYKGTRPKDNHEECMPQMTPIRRILKSIGIPVISKKGCEADDVIATLAVRYANAGILAMMSTNDKDSCQVVNEKIVRVEAKTRALLGHKETIGRFGVPPNKIIEFLMLQGDSSDNVPGVYKCGEKTAAKLLTKYGSINKILAHVDDLTPALSKNVKAAAPLFKVTRKVLTIDTNVSIRTNIKTTRMGTGSVDLETFNALCKDLEIRSTKREIKSVLL